MVYNMQVQNLTINKDINAAAYNTRLAQWGIAAFVEAMCFYYKFVVVGNLVFQSRVLVTPLRQAWERYTQLPDSFHAMTIGAK